jgi:cytidylate kinase
MLILLVGPKGSGKTYVGRLLETQLGVHFFHVEPYWMRYHAACAEIGQPVHLADGIARIHPLIAEALGTHEHVCVETTGASPEILNDLLTVGEPFGLLLVKVDAPLAVCLERIAARDAAHQIPMRADDIRTVHTLSSALDLPFDIVLDNTGWSDDALIRPFAEAGIGA